MTKPTFEDDFQPLFDDIIKPFKTSHELYEPIEGQQIYISTADRFDNPFLKMMREYSEENKLLTDVFDMDASIIVNEMSDGEITDFKIKSVSILRKGE